MRATKGGFYLVAHEQTIRWIIVLGVCIGASSWYVGLSSRDWVLVYVPLVMLFIAEGINTVIEQLIDLIQPRYAVHVGRIKDISAGIVLLAGLFAILVWYMVFSLYIDAFAVLGEMMR